MTMLAGGTVAMSQLACRILAPFEIQTLDGALFSHAIDLPEFSHPLLLRKLEIVGLHGEWVFRNPTDRSDKLLVTVCDDREGASVICSTNYYSIDPARSFRVQSIGAEQWAQARPANVQTLASFVDRKAKRVFEGFEYAGRTVPVRGEWVESRRLVASDDGSIIVVAAGKEQLLTHPNHIPIRHTAVIDVFDRNSNRLASIDMDYKPPNLGEYLDAVILIGSRWLVFHLPGSLRHMLLFDFKTTSGEAPK